MKSRKWVTYEVQKLDDGEWVMFDTAATERVAIVVAAHMLEEHQFTAYRAVAITHTERVIG